MHTEERVRRRRRGTPVPQNFYDGTNKIGKKNGTDGLGSRRQYTDAICPGATTDPTHLVVTGRFADDMAMSIVL